MILTGGQSWCAIVTILYYCNVERIEFSMYWEHCTLQNAISTIIVIIMLTECLCFCYHYVNGFLFCFVIIVLMECLCFCYHYVNVVFVFLLSLC